MRVTDGVLGVVRAVLVVVRVVVVVVRVVVRRDDVDVVDVRRVVVACLRVS